MLCLFDAAPYAYPVEAVENLMVSVAAYLSLFVYESVMDILSFDEVGDKAAVLGQDGKNPV